MQVLQVRLDDLRDAPRNANRLDDRKFKALVESIQRVGFVDPIAVRDLGDGFLEIVDGHHRARAMRELGETTIPALVIEPGEDPRLVAMALNRIRGETDLAVAGIMLQELMADGLDTVDLSISGFSEKEMLELVSALEGAEPSLDDLSGAELPSEVGSDVVKPFLIELTFRNRDEVAAVKKALRKAAGKGGALSDGLLRLIRAE